MSNYDSLWIEKFRPQILDDLCISDDLKQLITGWGDQIPHLLFLGNAGVGKTTLARILVQNILKCDYLYINASDENGIDTIRNKVTGFVQTKSLDGNIKVVILDEADGLTIDGQKCLRNLMESYANTARFILTGNFKHKISNAIQSRCQSIDIQPSFKESVIRCLNILKTEGIETTSDQKKLVIGLVKKNFPDLRKCIGELQKHCISGEFHIKQTENTSKLLNIIWENILKQKGLESRKYLIENESIFNSDWDQLLVDLLNHTYLTTVKDDMKKAMILTIADHLEKSSRVIDKEINFFACLLNLELCFD
jgi:DNA polymerase III delta prime subunit